MRVWFPGVGVGPFRFGQSAAELEKLYGDIWIPSSSFVDLVWGEYRIEYDDSVLDLRFDEGELTLITVDGGLFFEGVDVFQCPVMEFSKLIGCSVDIDVDESIPDAKFYSSKERGVVGCVYNDGAFFDYVMLQGVRS